MTWQQWSARAAGVLGVGAAIGLGIPTTLSAQRTHVLVVSGLSGDAAFKTRYATALEAVRTAAREQWGVQERDFVALTEDSVATGSAAARRSTRENVASAFADLSSRAAAGDVVLVLLMGHGSGEGPGSKVNLPGPDATAGEYAAWIAPLRAQQVVFVNAATGSGDFVPVLRGPGRVVITATRSAVEKNDAEFLQHFTRGLAGGEADADKDGRLTVLEAFSHAQREVTKSYERSNRMLTEHAVLSDSTAAARIAFGNRAASADPRIAALQAERQALESAVTALRTRKASMDADAYDAELERLLLAIAEKSAAIKAAGGAK
jgi:hypothetical protein